MEFAATAAATLGAAAMLARLGTVNAGAVTPLRRTRVPRHALRLRELHAPGRLHRAVPHAHRRPQPLHGGGLLLRGVGGAVSGQHLRRLLLARKRLGPAVDLREEHERRRGLDHRVEHRHGQREAQGVQQLTR
ncbi:hypothetical protein SBRY_60480 [Actinacidiphila bryophytorum]|uniref:Uncharacterized protein n=1 Tax=Actinacidiphila bryophytorum TaxID=1436133 RepID=A0A9W4H6N7_9ACTN|nr:hypothetical protein SBRY_60480 [Actinacidiphila bryophytorum]